MSLGHPSTPGVVREPPYGLKTGGASASTSSAMTAAPPAIGVAGDARIASAREGVSSAAVSGAVLEGASGAGSESEGEGAGACDVEAVGLGLASGSAASARVATWATAWVMAGASESVALGCG